MKKGARSGLLKDAAFDLNIEDWRQFEQVEMDKMGRGCSYSRRM